MLRYDYSHPEWKATSTRPGDPPLSHLGHQQARETGVFLDNYIHNEGISVENITWLSSPFVRCLQTSDDALNMMQLLDTDLVPILPEYSVFEMDGHDGKMHESLPPIEERAHYFPRLNASHESLFYPPLPEAREGLLPRCDKAMKLFNKRYRYSPKTAFIIVTHAAGCVGLVRAASQTKLADITPAAPCGIFLLTRTADVETWSIDQHDAPNSMNGYTQHISNMGTATKIWNHFGDKSVNIGYTGPPTSRYAPSNYAMQPPPPKGSGIPADKAGEL